MVEQAPELKEQQIGMLKSHLYAVTAAYFEHVRDSHNGKFGRGCIECATLSWYIKDRSKYLALLQSSKFIVPRFLWS